MPSAETTGGGHIKLTRGEKGPIFLPSTASDHRSYQNCRSKMLQFGIDC
jgi:hypothetical protein